MNELALFAGAGDGILGGHLLGWSTVCAVEIEKYPRDILLARQRDGVLPHFPVWDDVCTFDGTPWRGLVDVVSGGFPCQDISVAGKGAGIAGARSGLWSHMHRIICEIRPRFAFLENSPMLTARGLGTVLGDLAASGYNAAWLVLGADDVGAPHVRKRIWVLAHDTHPNSLQCTQRGGEHPRPQGSAGRCTDELDTGEAMDPDADVSRLGRGTSFERAFESSELVPDPNVSGREEQRQPQPASPKHTPAQRGGWWGAEPCVGRVANGVADRVDRLKALGNGQVPLVAATAFTALYKILTAKEKQ